MAKPSGKKPAVSRPVLMIGGLALLIGAFYAFSGDEAPRKGTGRPQARPQASGGSSRQTTVKFTEEDYNAEFVPVADAVRNAFRPEIRPVGTSALASLLPNEVPASFADGETKWRYTGTVTMDQSPQALIENAESGDFIYLRPGDSWKSCKVSKITPTSLTLLGPGGMTYTLQLMVDPLVEGDDVITDMRVEPLNPMAGDIGRGPANNRRAETNREETVAAEPEPVNKSAAISDTKSGDKANDAR